MLQGKLDCLYVRILIHASVMFRNKYIPRFTAFSKRGAMRNTSRNDKSKHPPCGGCSPKHSETQTLLLFNTKPDGAGVSRLDFVQVRMGAAKLGGQERVIALDNRVDIYWERSTRHLLPLVFAGTKQGNTRVEPLPVVSQLVWGSGSDTRRIKYP